MEQGSRTFALRSCLVYGKFESNEKKDRKSVEGEYTQLWHLAQNFLEEYVFQSVQSAMAKYHILGGL